MRVCLDARKIRGSGIGTYIRGLLNGFFRIGADLSWDFITRSNIASEDFSEWPKSQIHHCNATDYSLSGLFSVSRIANRSGCELFHSPHYVFPIGLELPLIVTIHDIIHLKFPQYFPLHKRSYACWMLERVRKRARRILTVSQWTRRDLIETLDMDESRIAVCYNGIDPRYFQSVSVEGRDQFRQSHGLPEGYLLYVGNLKPHKNVSGLIDAWAELSDSIRPPLVLVGAKIDHYPALIQQVHKLGKDKKVFFTGELPPDELAMAYRCAAALVQPSWYEGFGLPPVEAMACQIPVAVSNRASLPEIAGEAALIFDPADREQFIAALTELLTNSELRNSLTQRGLRQARKYTWEHAARKTLEAYQQIL